LSIEKTAAPREAGAIAYATVIPFALAHLACFAAFWSGVTMSALVLAVALYVVRMFAVTAGYHRLFSHKSYATGRVFQFILAFLAQTTAQKSVLWWAIHHRHHHLYSDTPDDLHSARRRGFLHAHVGWIFQSVNDDVDFARAPDLTRYPELVWLHDYELVPPVALALFCVLVAGWPGLVVGFFWSTVAVWHATFCINSLAHVHGTKRYVTGDDSCNNWWLALLTMGEGWHNNHHFFQASVRQGFRWWEVDLTFYILKALSLVGVVRDHAPAAARRRAQRAAAGAARDRAGGGRSGRDVQSRVHGGQCARRARRQPDAGACAGADRRGARAGGRSCRRAAVGSRPRGDRGAGAGHVRTHAVARRNRRAGASHGAGKPRRAAGAGDA
jgi:stearoyl-CoA desaturase (delta-9 desaturase)